MHIDDLKRNWDALGRNDPFWAVLTSPDKKGGKWDLRNSIKQASTKSTPY